MMDGWVGGMCECGGGAQILANGESNEAKLQAHVWL